MNKLHDVVQILKAAGWKNNCDAQWSGIEAALPELAALLSCNSPAKPPAQQQAEPVAFVQIGSHAPILPGSDGLHFEGTPSGALKVTCTREHAPAVAVPEGWDAESVRLAFSTIRYIIGLKPDGIKAPCDHVQDIIDKVASWSDMGPCHPVRKQYEADAAHRAMLAAAQKGGA